MPVLLLNSSFAKGSLLKHHRHLGEKNIIKNFNGNFWNVHLTTKFWSTSVLKRSRAFSSLAPLLFCGALGRMLEVMPWLGHSRPRSYSARNPAWLWKAFQWLQSNGIGAQSLSHTRTISRDWWRSWRWGVPKSNLFLLQLWAGGVLQRGSSFCVTWDQWSQKAQNY